MSAPSLFDAATSEVEERVVDVSTLGPISSIVVTESQAKLRCENGTLLLSPEQYFEFVRYRKARA